MLKKVQDDIDLFLQEAHSKEEYLKKLKNVKTQLKEANTLVAFLEEEIPFKYDALVEWGFLKEDDVTPDLIAYATEKLSNQVESFIDGDCIHEELVKYAHEKQV
ncbi:MAG: hypothetical protein RSC93_02480 [Erysipelotrichaceae bacterium]